MLKFSRKKDKDEYDEVAEVLINDFVNDISIDRDLRKEYRDDHEFLDKCIVYRIAIVLMVLISEKKGRGKLLNLRIAFEKMIFGEPSQKSSRLLKEVQLAMKDLSGLLFADSPKQMTWAKNWLHSIGIEEHTPVDLAMVAYKWMDSYIVCVKTIREIFK
jgi:hypothetical protein